MSELTIEVASVPDRSQVVAELWAGSEQVAELSQEEGKLILQVYPAPHGRWDFDYEQFLAAVKALRQRLGT